LLFTSFSDNTTAVWDIFFGTKHYELKLDRPIINVQSGLCHNLGIIQTRNYAEIIEQKGNKGYAYKFNN